MSGESPSLTLLQQRRNRGPDRRPHREGFRRRAGAGEGHRDPRSGDRGARQAGRAELARRLGEQSLEAFARSLDVWRERVLSSWTCWNRHRSGSRSTWSGAATPRCTGPWDWPISVPRLSCQRDFSLAEGFSPEIQLTRTQTLMGGASFCDFRFRRIAPSRVPGRAGLRRFKLRG